MRFLTKLAGWLRWLEDFISLVSGPVLVAGLSIGVISLLTDGKLLLNAPVLLYIWAGAQTVGVDAYTVVVWDNAARAFRAGKYAGAVVLAAFGCVLAYVGFVAAQVFSMQQTYGMTVSQALGTLGMSPLAWLYQRNGLAIFLVIVFAVTRAYIGQETKTVQQLEEEAQLEEARLKVKARLAPLKRQAGEDFGEKAGKLWQRAKAKVTHQDESPAEAPTLTLVPTSAEVAARELWRPGMSGYRLHQTAKAAGVALSKSSADKWAAVLAKEKSSAA